jgi:hypothetical protein
MKSSRLQPGFSTGLSLLRSPLPSIERLKAVVEKPAKAGSAKPRRAANAHHRLKPVADIRRLKPANNGLP